MKLSLSLLTLVAPLLALASGPTPVTRLRLNPDPSSLSPRQEYAPAPAPVTNAARFALGLNPKPPVHGKHRRAAQSPTPPVTATGHLLAYDSEDHLLGYVGNKLNTYGEYGVTSVASEYLLVSYTVSSDNNAVPFDIRVLNGQTASTYPFLGATVGFTSTDDLNTGSTNYAYLTGVGSSTGQSSVPKNVPNSFSAASGLTKNSETTIWTLDPTSHALSGHWINTNGNAAPTYLAYYAPDNVFVLVGDLGAFTTSFGGVGAKLVLSPLAG
ncbi:hypothetical protein CYLTODRAFT_407255 [Cylindrobasidium torrendii FP15055 ss-10]|uniref:Acid protease n=1 Tax=Cylindrobasidium torrendii FP15055 ss-10 TaxID=1314674 RepID=A0A0D7BQL7_9AGAR|nr:hypothetical protein CYLTODRAFT_407255 [Cylindrobasidium torrendii FP15055 ss-10]